MFSLTLLAKSEERKANSDCETIPTAICRLINVCFISDEVP